MQTKPWSGQDNDDHAASYVNWYDAVEFCNKLSEKEGLRPCYEVSSIRREDDGTIESAEVTTLSTDTGYRLPTEAEWEYACRAGAPTRFCYGDNTSRLAEYAWYCDNADIIGEDYVHSVGQKKSNAWGLYDMHGKL